jgi:hypothetical protein
MNQEFVVAMVIITVLVWNFLRAPNGLLRPSSPCLLNELREIQASAFDSNSGTERLTFGASPGTTVNTRARIEPDCIQLKSPSTLVKTVDCYDDSVQQTTLKTSSQWYLSRPNRRQVLVCPLGWTQDLSNPELYYYNNLITFDEFASRMARSISVENSDPELENQEPF